MGEAEYCILRELLGVGGGVEGERKSLEISRRMNGHIRKFMAGSHNTYNLVVTQIQNQKPEVFQPPSMDIINSTSLKELHTNRRISLQCVSHADVYRKVALNTVF